MRALLSFRVADSGLELGEFARLLLDLQHLAILAVALGRSSPVQNAVDWSQQSYHWMVEASRHEIGEATVTITRFDIGTPLRLEFAFPQVAPELAEQTAMALRALLQRLQLIDLERERKAHRLDRSERPCARSTSTTWRTRWIWLPGFRTPACGAPCCAASKPVCDRSNVTPA